MIRLRQVALVARDLDAAVADIRHHLDVDVCFRDPGVAEFGLHNALFRIGDQFLEVVSPTGPGTTAGRLLERAGGDCGYMAIFEVDNLDERMARLASLGVRTVWQGNFSDIRGRHLHPKDTGGTLVSLDQPHEPGEWRWGGPSWREAQGSAFTSVTGITLASADHARLRARWHELGIDSSATFSAHTGPDRLVGVEISSPDPSRRGLTFSLCGVTFTVG